MQYWNITKGLLSPCRCRWLPLLRLLRRPTPRQPLPRGCLLSRTTLPGRSSGCGDFSAPRVRGRTSSFREGKLSSQKYEYTRRDFFFNLGHTLVFSLVKYTRVGHQTRERILPACPCAQPTHPRARVLSLVARQDVKYVSFLQRKYGRYEDPVVASVVVSGSFPSSGPVGRDPDGDHCTTRGLNTVTERNCSPSQAPQHITLDIDVTPRCLS